MDGRGCGWWAACALLLATGCGGTTGAAWPEPGAVDFGAVAHGATEVRTVAITQGAGTPVTVDALTVAPVDPLDGAFHLVSPPALPVELAVGDALEVEVAFTASGTRRAETVLMWTAETPGIGGAVPLVGQGNGPALVAEPGALLPSPQSRFAFSSGRVLMAHLDALGEARPRGP